MVHKLFLLEETLRPFCCRVEFLLSKLGLARWLSTLERLKLILRVQVLPSDPLDELLIVDFASHGHLQVTEGLLGRLNGHSRVV